MIRALLIVLILSFIIGCGGPGLFEMSPPAEEIAYSAMSKNRSEQIAQKAFSAADRSLVYTGFFRISSLTPDSVHKTVIGLTQKFDGYILESEIERTTIRVASIHLNEVVETIEGLGRVLKKDISGLDITDDYKDLQVRLENAMKSRDRYLQLLDNAANINEILRVEKELERLNKDIDYLEGKISRMSHQIQYATITVETSEKLKAGVVGSLFVGIYKGVKWLFVR